MTAALPPLDVNSETVKSNSFSKHDNRHTTENFGIYLGGGLGRKLTEPHRDQHRSDKQLFTHAAGGKQHKFTSTYVSGYRLITEDQALRRCSSATEGGVAYTQVQTDKEKWPTNAYSIGSTKETFRRFPQRYALPKDKEGARPSMNTIWWYNSSPKGGSAQGRPNNHSREQKTSGSENQRCLTSLESGRRPRLPDHKNIIAWKY